jgi:FtsH-binding integral membrane protein
MLSFLLRFLIITTVVSAVVEMVVYWQVSKYGASLPVFLVAVAGIVIPIMINLWYWLPRYGLAR